MTNNSKNIDNNKLSNSLESVNLYVNDIKNNFDHIMVNMNMEQFTKIVNWYKQESEKI